MSENPERDNGPAYARPLSILAGLAVLAAALLLVVWRLRPPAPLPPTAPPALFSAGRAEEVLQEILGDTGPHPIGSASHEVVRERIVSRLESLGYTPTVQETAACRSYDGASAICGSVQNILAELPGQTTGPALLLVAHYDSGGISPGAADNGSGVVVLLEVARLLKAQGPLRNPVLFLFSDGEEVGMLGAQAFVDEHPWAQRIGVVVNLEARGTSGRVLMFETSVDNAWLVSAYATAPHPAANSLMYEAYKAMPNETDFSVFKSAGLPGLNLAYIEGGARYHTPLDNLDNLDRGSLQHQGEMALALAQALAGRDLADRPLGDAAYMDILGLVLLRWPAGWTTPLAVLALLLPAAVAAVFLLQKRLSLPALGQGLLAALLAVGLPILLGLGLTWLVSTVAGNSTPWYAHPLPMRLALWGGALLCAILAGARLGRPAGFWGLALGTWLFWSLLALVTALLVPGAAILLIVPALWAGVLLTIIGFTPLATSPWARESAALAAVFPAALIGLQLALQFEAAFQFNASPTVTLAVGLVASTLLPLLALPPGKARRQRILALAAAGITLAGTLAAIVVPPFSAAAPRPLNLYHVEDYDSRAAYWTAGARLETLPSPLREQFDTEPQAVFPWSANVRPVAVSTPTGDPAPSLEVLSEESSGAGRTVRLQLHSPRGGGEVDLYVPIGQLQAVTVAGQELPVQESASWNGFYNLWCYGQGCDGIEVTLRFTATAPQEVILADWTMGLPVGGERFVQARPAWTTPAYEGDLTTIIRRVKL